MQATDNSNEWINWINEAISKKLIKYYEYDHFITLKKLVPVVLEKFIVQTGRTLINV